MQKSWLNIEGKSIIITGGASGLGYAVAEELLEDGANVTVCDLFPTAPEFKHTGGRLLYVKTDVACRQAVNDMFDQVIRTFGRVDVLVNNAGICIPRLLVNETGGEELTEKIWDKVMNVNVKGLFFCSQAAAKLMLAQRSGVIINMSSESGLEGSEGQSVYSASKGAINSLTRSWAKELGKKGVRVVGIAPGVLEATPLRTLEYETALANTRDITVEQLRANYSKVSNIPLNRTGKLSEVAATVAFLASERAGYIHGVTINVAGGKTRG